MTIATYCNIIIIIIIMMVGILFSSLFFDYTERATLSATQQTVIQIKTYKHMYKNELV